MHHTRLGDPAAPEAPLLSLRADAACTCGVRSLLPHLPPSRGSRHISGRSWRLSVGSVWAVPARWMCSFRKLFRVSWTIWSECGPAGSESVPPSAAGDLLNRCIPKACGYPHPSPIYVISALEAFIIFITVPVFCSTFFF